MPVVVDLMMLVENILSKRALGKILLLVSILLKGWREEKKGDGGGGEREEGMNGGAGAINCLGLVRYDKYCSRFFKK